MFSDNRGQWAVAQDVAVLTFFRLRPWESFSPSQIHGVVGKGAPVTSIRRAMTNLTKKGCLVKLKDKRTGPFGRPEHLWILRQTQS